MDLPHELYVYILSFLDSRYEIVSYHRKTRCLAYTNTSNFHLKCKKRSCFYFCHLHRNMPIENMLCCIQPPSVRNKNETKTI